jgi:hypothetical protein
MQADFAPKRHRRRLGMSPEHRVKLRHVEVRLTPEEKGVLVAGLVQWGGPARMTDEVATVVGFESASAFHADTQRLRRNVERGQLSSTDARRALVATEIVFASDVIGAGVEWETVTGLSDVDTLRLLRGLQRKLIKLDAAQDAQ